jgi:hypothetical protein
MEVVTAMKMQFAFFWVMTPRLESKTQPLIESSAGNFYYWTGNIIRMAEKKDVHRTLVGGTLG